MFGADTPLVMDALQMAGLAAIAGGGAVYLLLRHRKRAVPKAASSQMGSQEDKLDLEKRVRVLERIATDSSADLSDEIEALRKITPDAAKRMEGTTP